MYVLASSPRILGLPRWHSGKESACQYKRCRRCRSGSSPGVGNGNLLQYSCQENAMDRGAWWATVHGVAKSWTRLSDWVCMHARAHTHTQRRILVVYSYVKFKNKIKLKKNRLWCRDSVYKIQQPLYKAWNGIKPDLGIECLALCLPHSRGLLSKYCYCRTQISHGK